MSRTGTPSVRARTEPVTYAHVGASKDIVENARQSLRQRRRLRVTLGRTTSFTSNVSQEGFCTEAMRVNAPGTQVEGAICVEGNDYAFAGSVVWAKPGDPRICLRGRMGVRFSSVSPGFQRMVGGSSPVL